jgi:hypothetical protein
MFTNVRKFNAGEVPFLAFILVLSLVFTVSTAAAAPVTAHFSSLSGNNQNGEYTYPYFVSIEGGPALAMMCDDFHHGSAVGDMWSANITMLSSGDLSETRFGDFDTYREASFLLEQTTLSPVREWGNINWAVWKLFDPSINPGAGPVGTLGPEYWYDLAQTTDLSDLDLTSIAILTPLDAHGIAGDQEFLFVTPEPATLLLMGGALLGVWHRRKSLA